MKNADVFKKMYAPVRNLFALGRKLNYIEHIGPSQNAAWLVRTTKGSVLFGASVCFGTTAGKTFTNFASIIGPKFEHTYRTPEEKKAARNYLNYVFKRSIFSKYYKNTNVSDALKYGFEIDCHNAPRSLMLCALAAVRSCWERRAMQGFNLLRRIGFDEHRAFLLSAYIKHTGKGDCWILSPLSHSHTVFPCLNAIDIKRALDGTPRFPEIAPICRNKFWSGAHGQFTATNQRKQSINVENLEESLRAHRKYIEFTYCAYDAYDMSKPEVAKAFFDTYNSAITKAYNQV